METIVTRRSMFIGLLPKVHTFNMSDTLEPGQQITRTIKAKNFEMCVIVRAEKNCVLTSQQINWYDPISKDDMFKNKNEIFIIDTEEL